MSRYDIALGRPSKPWVIKDPVEFYYYGIDYGPSSETYLCILGYTKSHIQIKTHESFHPGSFNDFLRLISMMGKTYPVRLGVLDQAPAAAEMLCQHKLNFKNLVINNAFKEQLNVLERNYQDQVLNKTGELLFHEGEQFKEGYGESFSYALYALDSDPFK